MWFMILIGRRIVAGRSQEWLSGTPGRLFRINKERGRQHGIDENRLGGTGQ